MALAITLLLGRRGLQGRSLASARLRRRLLACFSTGRSSAGQLLCVLPPDRGLQAALTRLSAARAHRLEHDKQAEK